MTTKIEWADETWNPVTGCTPISAGCRNCYARRMARRLGGRFGYPADDPFRVTFHRDRLDQPLKWRKPRRVFVCSMGDLFHQDVPDRFIHQVMVRIGYARRHDFVLLTKRAERMAEYFAAVAIDGIEFSKNLWLGVTAENEAAADERIPYLHGLPARVRFASFEPLLGRVATSPLYRSWWGQLDWIVVGCETGPRRRHCDLEWVTHLLDLANAAGVPVFVKQLQIDGRVSRDPAEWPEELRRREIPSRE